MIERIKLKMAERGWEGVSVLQKVTWESLVDMRTLEERPEARRGQRAPHGVLREEHWAEGAAACAEPVRLEEGLWVEQGWVSGDCPGRSARVCL